MFSQGLLVSVALLMVLGLVTAQPILVVLASLILMVRLAAWLWKRFALEGVVYERVLGEKRAFIGEKLDLFIRVANRKILPLPWVEVKDEFPKDLEVAGKRLSPCHLPTRAYLNHAGPMSWYERVTWHYQIECRARGYYKLGPATVRSGDVFGFSVTERQEAGVDYLLVYPRIVPLCELGLPARRPFGDLRGGKPIFEDPTRIRGLRDYQQTDPLKRVDWKATARSQALKVKVFEPTITHNLMVMLNLDTIGEVWEGYDPVLLEGAVTVAASVAKYAFDERSGVGLLANAQLPGSNQPVKIPPSRDPRQLARILESLAMVGPFTTSSMHVLLEAEGRGLPFGSTLVLVTAILPPRLQIVLSRLREGGHSLAVLSVGEKELPGLAGIKVYPVGSYLKRWQRENS